jgi:membrane protease YdiL (CAAX protease family)
MNFIREEQEEYSPYLQLLMLIAFAIVGVFAATLLTFLCCFLVYGPAFFHNIAGFLSGDVKYLTAIKILQIFTSIGLFLVPPILLAWFQHAKLERFYGFKVPKFQLVLILLFIMIVSMPAMEWIATLNQKMTLPGFLKPLENWMRTKEDEAMSMTILLLTVHSSWDFVVNLFMIALIPAVAEELMFRGGIQRSLTKLTHNPHLGIWAAAFLFSAIHVQFFGFFPRLLLGAGFGYLYYWTGSMWYAMIAHFLNNAYAVCISLYLQLHHIPLDSSDPTVPVQWYGYLISITGTVLLFKYFKNQSKISNEQQLG